MLGVARNLGDILKERRLCFRGREICGLFTRDRSVAFAFLLSARRNRLVTAAHTTAKTKIAARDYTTRNTVFYLHWHYFYCHLVIQFVARQCFVFNNLLLARTLPGPAWLQAVLLDDPGSGRTSFLHAQVGATALTAACLMAGEQTARLSHSAAVWSRNFWHSFSCCRFLLLPINYSILIAHKSFPRVAESQAGAGRRTWLIWENNNGATSIVLHAASL